MIPKVKISEEEYENLTKTPFIVKDGQNVLNFPQCLINRDAIKQLAASVGFECKLFHNGREI